MSLPDIQTQLTALAARVSALDGQNLADPNQGFVQQTNAKIEGVKTDLSQSVLSHEGLLTTLQSGVNSLWTAVATVLGVTPPSSTTSSSGSTTVPPPAS